MLFKPSAMPLALPANPFRRETLVQQLTAAPTWDLIVIGGGATGLGVGRARRTQQ